MIFSDMPMPTCALRITATPLRSCRSAVQPCGCTNPPCLLLSLQVDKAEAGMAEADKGKPLASVLVRKRFRASVQLTCTKEALWASCHRCHVHRLVAAKQ